MNPANHVTKARYHFPNLGGRIGTIDASLDEFMERFGPPQQNNPKEPGTKVTACWTFATPRGYANVRDYWWNGPRELSMDAQTRKAGLWARAWLRAQGLRAYPGMPKGGEVTP